MINPFIFNEPLNPKIHAPLIVRTDLIAALLDHVNARKYCLVLGPKYSGRTTLLKSLCSRLSVKDGYATVYIHPLDLTLSKEAYFFRSLARLIETEVRRLGDEFWPTEMKTTPVEIESNADAFNSFLEGLISRLPVCLVLMIDAIERIPPNILTRAADIFQGFYNERPTRPQYRNLCVIFAGSVSLRHLTYEEHPELSPFNICENVIIRDVETSEARRFLEHVCEHYELRFRHDAISAIIDLVAGDLNALQRVAHKALKRVEGGQDVDRSVVEDVVEAMIGQEGLKADEALRYSTMLVEENTVTLDLVLDVLQAGSAKYDPSTNDNALYVTFNVTYPEMAGALALDRSNGSPVSWHFRNRLTELFFRRYFTVQRIVRTYSATGQFDKAASRCGALLDRVRQQFEADILRFDDSDLKDVLIAFTNRIYESGIHESAFEFIALLLKRGFGYPDATYYDYVPTQRTLQAVEFLSGLFSNDGETIRLEDSKSSRRLEVRVLHAKVFAIESAEDGIARIAIPLQNLNGEVTGVVTLRSDIQADRWANINLKIQVIQRALRVINLALNKVELDRKTTILESIGLIRNKDKVRDKGKVKVFVAHRFSSELLTNLREHLGRVSDALDFRYADEGERVGMLSKLIKDEITTAGLCLYEVSHANNNVFFELGLGLGINRPGLMFWRQSEGGQTKVPALLDGISQIGYADYNSLLENLMGRIDSVWKQYLAHERDQDYLHFAGARVPSVKKKTPYALVLESTHFSDRGDYRSVLNGIMEARNLKVIYPVGADPVVREVLQSDEASAEPPLRILDWLNLVRHAEVVIGRIEQTDADPTAGQVFLGLGMAIGVGHRNVILTRLMSDHKGMELNVPADLRGMSCFSYYSGSELRTHLGSPALWQVQGE